MSSAKNFPCPSCGANVSFDIDSGGFKCPYCDSEFTAEQLKEIYGELSGGAETDTRDTVVSEPDVSQADMDAFSGTNALYTCGNCGAAVITDSVTSATSCHYCHSPVVLQGRVSGKYRPSLLIPFKYKEARAKQAFAGFVKKRIFLPTGFRDAALTEVRGLYVPYWTADCNLDGQIIANCEKRSVRTSGNTETTTHRVYSVVRGGELNFNRIPADASKKADDTLMENLEPFDSGAAVKFDMSYLAGMIAERYDVEKEEVSPHVQERAKKAATDRLRSDISGYNSVNVVGNTLAVRDIKWEHMLFPLWFLSYSFKDRQYQFAMNGQTGKFAGNLPVDKAKAALFGLLLTLLFAVAGLVAGIIYGGTAPALSDEEMSAQYFYDESGTVSDDKISEYDKTLLKAYAATGLRTAVVVTDRPDVGMSEAGAMNYADDFYDRRFGINTDGILLLINNYEPSKYNWISTSGKGINRWSDDDIQDTFDYFWNDMKNRDTRGYDTIVNKFANRVMYYGQCAIVDGKLNFACVMPFAGIGAVVGLIVVAITLGTVKTRYTIAKSVTAVQYLDNRTSKISERKDVFIRQYTTTRRIQTSSGGGGTSTHRSSGGGSHGGGGRRG